MKKKLLILAVFLGAACGTPAAAGVSIPGQNHVSGILRYPGAPKPVYDDTAPPYAMTYVEEAAQSLGVRNGRMDVFSTQPSSSSSYMPSISGGVGGDGAMLRLKWHPGE